MTELVTETTLAMALRDRYGEQAGNGHRYAYAAQVRSHAGFDAKRTMDFIAMDLWPSKRFALHGHEIKVSRADWLRELKDPAKAGEFVPFMNYWWVVVPDATIIRDGELPAGWGLLALRGTRLTTVTQAARRAAEPMPLTRIAALLRAVAADARNCRPAPADLQTATAADLAAEVERLRAKQNQVAGKAHRAQQLADKWRDAYAIAAPAGLPCAHCGQPLKPSPRSLHSSWRHVRKADEAACLENLPHRWTSLYPAEETEPPEMPCTAQTSL